MLNFIYYITYVHTCVFVVWIKCHDVYKVLILSPYRNAQWILAKLMLMTVGKLTGTGCLLSGISSSPYCMAAFASETKPKKILGMGRNLLLSLNYQEMPLTMEG